MFVSAHMPRSGSVCLDVINQTWSPMFDMINIFEVFLPQLLRYPNPTDPLNGEAAALLMREPKSYEVKVKGERTISVNGKGLAIDYSMVRIRLEICHQGRGGRGGRRQRIRRRDELGGKLRFRGRGACGPDGSLMMLPLQPFPLESHGHGRSRSCEGVRKVFWGLIDRFRSPLAASGV